MIKKQIILIIIILISLTHCSSAPKNPGDIFTMRKNAEAALELGNKEADRGSFNEAALQLEEALRIAISIDDPSLRLRANLSLGNLMFILGNREEAQENWNKALAESKDIDNTELAAICRIHIARGNILMSDDKNRIRTLRDEVSKDMAFIRSERQYTAFSWTVIALAEKELGNFSDAEAAVMRSLAIHEKDKYFELAAYNWFMIASFRSLSGDSKGAISALHNAIIFDRRVENAWGLASNWRALGDVHKKAGNLKESNAAYTRSAEIFRAIGNAETADEVLSRISE